MKKIAILFSFFVGLSATQLKVPSQYSTIQLAINAASAGDTVFVAAGNYTENIIFKGKNIVVLGESKETTSIDGYANHSVVTFKNGEKSSAVLKRFTIKNGRMMSYSQGSDGGGIYIKDSSPTLSELIITNNKAYRGGAISINFPSTHSFPMPSINSSIIIGNTTDDGAAIHFEGKIQGSIFNNCLIISNTGHYDEAVEVYSENSNPTLTNVTISGHGIGIRQSYGGSVIVKNSIIWGNSSSVYGSDGSSSTLKEATYSIISGGHTGTGNLDTDPKFVKVITTGDEESDYHLTYSSPAIGAGTATGAPTTDIEGNPRPNPAGSNPDMGAYENKLGAPNSAPTAFKWVDSKKDTINITKENLATSYKFEWTNSTDSNGDKLLYLLHAKIGSTPWQEINEDLEGTSFETTYQEFLGAAFEPFPTVNAVTAAFLMYVTDGIDTVKIDDIPKVIYVRRYDYLSTIDDQIPTDFALHENYPNPFNPTTTLRFDLPEMSDVNVVIYNMLGQKVRTFNMNSISAGSHSIKWNATNDLGDPVGAGVYLYQFQANDFLKTKKMVLLK